MPAAAAARPPAGHECPPCRLGAADVDGRRIEIDLLPANVDQLADQQRMPEGG
jgi:hypothetical protein